MSKFKVEFCYDGKPFCKESVSTDIIEDNANKEPSDVLKLKYNYIALMNILQRLCENGIYIKDSITVSDVKLYKDDAVVGDWKRFSVSYSIVA